MFVQKNLHTLYSKENNLSIIQNKVVIGCWMNMNYQKSLSMCKSLQRKKKKKQRKTLINTMYIVSSFQKEKEHWEIFAHM